jgi:hypothetical protein
MAVIYGQVATLSAAQAIDGCCSMRNRFGHLFFLEGEQDSDHG